MEYVCPKLTEGPEVYVKRYRRVGDYVGTVLKTLALVFGMKINNPAGAYTHLMLAVDALAAKHSTHDIEVWPAGWQVRSATSSNASFVRAGSRCGETPKRNALGVSAGLRRLRTSSRNRRAPSDRFDRLICVQ